MRAAWRPVARSSRLLACCFVLRAMRDAGGGSLNRRTSFVSFAHREYPTRNSASLENACHVLGQPDEAVLALNHLDQLGLRRQRIAVIVDSDLAALSTR